MRQYLIGSWNNADGYDYSGEQLMSNRNGASRRVHFNADGSAAVQNYGDDEPKKKTSIPLADRILPQARRVRTLTEQLIELEQERKAGMDIKQYSQLRDILVAKRDRAEILLKQAMAKKPVRNTEDDYPAPQHTSTANASFQPEFVQEKGQNSVKKAVHSAKRDAIVFLIGAVSLLVVVKFFF